MRFYSIILLITSILFVICSAWTISQFIRLEQASRKYDSDTLFESACNVSKSYTENGKKISIIFLTISICLLILSSVIIYKDY